MASLKYVTHNDIIYAFFQLTLVQYSFHLFESSIHKNVKYEKKNNAKSSYKCLSFFWFNFVELFFLQHYNSY